MHNVLNNRRPTQSPALSWASWLIWLLCVNSEPSLFSFCCSSARHERLPKIATSLAQIRLDANQNSHAKTHQTTISTLHVGQHAHYARNFWDFSKPHNMTISTFDTRQPMTLLHITTRVTGWQWSAAELPVHVNPLVMCLISPCYF